MAIAHDNKTINTNSVDNNFQTFNTEAHNALRIQISFVLCSATKEAMPNRPIQLMKIASTAKKLDSLPMRCSFSNFRAYCSSINWYSNGCDGLYFLNTDSILLSAADALMIGFSLTVIMLPISFDK